MENTSAEEEVHSSSDFTHKKIVKLSGSEKNRYRALRQLKIPSTEALELSKKTFVELREMGYMFGSLLCKPGGKTIKRPDKRPKHIRSKRSRHDALKKIGVTSNLQELSRKSFAELKQMGFKFSSQKPVKMPVKQNIRLAKGNTSESPKANYIDIRHPPKQTDTETVPTQPRQQHTYSESEGPIRVGIEDAKPMTDSQLETLSHTILENIASMSQGEGPRFNGYSRKPGWFLITCNDQRSKNWLEELIPSLKPWPGASLKVITESELRKPNIAVVFIPNIDITMIEQSLSLIRAQNTLRTELWKVVHSKPQKRGVFLTLSLDDMSVEELQKKDMKANLGFGKVQFRLKGIKARQSGTDFPASNSLPDQSLPGISSSDPNLDPAPNVLASKRAIPCHPISNLPETSEVCQVPSTERFSNRGIAHREIHQRYSSTESYRGREDIRVGSRYSCIEDITGYIEGGSSYSGREDMRGDINRDYGSRDVIKGGASFSGDHNVSGGFGGTSYNGSEDINRVASISGRKDSRGDKQRDCSYSGRGNIRKNFYGGSSITGRGNILGDASYSVRDDVGSSYDDRASGDIHRGPSYSGREDIDGKSSNSGREYFNRDVSYSRIGDVNQDISYRGREAIRRDICHCDTDNIRGNHIQQHSKRDINDDISGFKGGRYTGEDGTQLHSSPGFSRVSDIDIMRSGGTTGLGGNDDRQLDRNRSIGEDMRDFSDGRSFGGIASHGIFSPSTGSYVDRNFGGHKRGIHAGAKGFGGRKGSQIHQLFPPGSRGNSQIPQSSSNWGNSKINSMGRGYTKGGQYSAGSIQRHTRGNTQRYTRGGNRRYTTENSQRYTRDDQWDAKEVNQSDTRKGW